PSNPSNAIFFLYNKQASKLEQFPAGSIRFNAGQKGGCISFPPFFLSRKDFFVLCSTAHGWGSLLLPFLFLYRRVRIRAQFPRGGAEQPLSLCLRAHTSVGILLARAFVSASVVGRERALQQRQQLPFKLRTLA
uniref:Uncharacterized protein n=1 Tax=Aegilops tauschii subsp. strangulata TaxID=200361 RepID=A0A453KYN5_AEGTS